MLLRRQRSSVSSTATTLKWTRNFMRSIVIPSARIPSRPENAVPPSPILPRFPSATPQPHLDRLEKEWLHRALSTSPTSATSAVYQSKANAESRVRIHVLGIGPFHRLSWSHLQQCMEQLQPTAIGLWYSTEQLEEYARWLEPLYLQQLSPKHLAFRRDEDLLALRKLARSRDADLKQAKYLRQATTWMPLLTLGLPPLFECTIARHSRCLPSSLVHHTFPLLTQQAVEYLTDMDQKQTSLADKLAWKMDQFIARNLPQRLQRQAIGFPYEARGLRIDPLLRARICQSSPYLAQWLDVFLHTEMIVCSPREMLQQQDLLLLWQRIFKKRQLFLAQVALQHVQAWMEGGDGSSSLRRTLLLVVPQRHALMVEQGLRQDWMSKSGSFAYQLLPAEESRTDRAGAMDATRLDNSSSSSGSNKST